MTRLAALALSLLVVLAPAPAEAKLGETFLRFKYSELIRGNEGLYRFEGRVGARYRFGPTRRNDFASSVFILDTQDGIIVQQTLILPYPRNKQDVRRVEGLAGLFLRDAGLDEKHLKEALQAFRLAYEAGKNYETGKDSQQPKLTFEEKLNLNVITGVQLGHILLAIGLKPDAQATPEPTP